MNSPIPDEDLHFVQKVLPAQTIDDLPPQVLDRLEEMALDLADDNDNRIAVKALLEDLRKHHHFSINNNLCAPIADYLIDQHPHLEAHIRRRARVPKGQHRRKATARPPAPPPAPPPPPEVAPEVPIMVLLDRLQKRLTERGYPLVSISCTREGQSFHYVLPKP